MLSCNPAPEPSGFQTKSKGQRAYSSRRVSRISQVHETAGLDECWVPSKSVKETEMTGTSLEVTAVFRELK